MKLLAAFIFLSCIVYAQSDLQRWSKADISYQVKSPYTERSYGIEQGALTDMFVSTLTHIYWIFISDVDGDNCSFSPTCSSFFVESVKRPISSRAR